MPIVREGVVARVGRGTWSPEGGLSDVVIGGRHYGFYEYAVDQLIGDRVGERAATDPTVDPLADDFRAAMHGVRGFQVMLRRRGFYGNPPTGVFDLATEDAVVRAQARMGRSDLTEGRIGHTVATFLMRERCDRLEATYGIPGHLLFGVGHLESDGFDLGAVGETTPDDKGPWQFNCSPGARTWWNYPLDGRPEVDITVARAFGPLWASEQAARRMAYARRVLFSDKEWLTSSCSVLYHFSPTRAARLFSTERWPVDSDGVHRAEAYWDAVNGRIDAFY